jgi:predicted metal-dependent phosphoesterase TrpH
MSEEYLKFDMHCHTKEGSLDAKISVVEHARELKEKGYDGMLVTDHDSYRAYRKWIQNDWAKEVPGFLVLRGIEYDTIDAGHILCILPEGMDLRLMERKGLPVSILIDFVHYHGGICGPAHPYGQKYVSFINTMKQHKQLQMIKRFDFLEGFNACETEESNQKAQFLAETYHLPTTGGSDAHRSSSVGHGYTLIPGPIRNNDDLIEAILERGEEIKCGGTYYHRTVKQTLGPLGNALNNSFWLYNRIGGLWRKPSRNREMRKLYLNEILQFDKKKDTEQAKKESETQKPEEEKES